MIGLLHAPFFADFRKGEEFGGVAQVQEEVRETWLWRWLDDRSRDLGEGRADLGGTALPSPVSTGSGSKGCLSIAPFIGAIPLAVP